ncbi:hypothetical protein CF326_g8173 [Tilletia indica]|nr:hypothetical protein CF326_g8173 [Tilletia indica]
MEALGLEQAFRTGAQVHVLTAGTNRERGLLNLRDDGSTGLNVSRLLELRSMWLRFKPPRSDPADASRPPATSSSRASASSPGDAAPREEAGSVPSATPTGLEISLPELVLAARRAVQDADRTHKDVNIIRALSADPITGPRVRRELAGRTPPQAAAPSHAAGGAEGGLAVGVGQLPDIGDMDYDYDDNFEVLSTRHGPSKSSSSAQPPFKRLRSGVPARSVEAK